MKLLPRRRLFALLILISIVFFIPYSPAHADKITDLIRKTRQELRKKKQKEHSVMSSLIQSQKKLTVSQQKLEQINKQLTTTHSQVQMTEVKLHGLEQNLTHLEKKQDARRDLMSERLKALYKYGIVSYLQVFFEADYFADFVSRFEMGMYFLRHDMQTINNMELHQEIINSKKVEATRKKMDLEKQQQVYTAIQQQVDKEKKEYSQYVVRSQMELESIQADRKRLEAALDEYERTSREIEQQIKKTERTDGIRLGTGKMIWPVRGRIASPFGYRYHPILHRQKYHNGLDIAVPSGTPVLAADSGVVLVSGWRGGYGNYVAIDHGNGISSAYGHNSVLLVRVGDKVVRGQVIAKSGSTGLSTGPHVHFEIRIKGQPANPMPYLP
ncbi:MAG TPA: peptidoglycan DD-metalloendopeptidase family protein [Bacillota bacterium]|nr:peptidoglycan DD-metalloendopeptidase family protein [Bacillota bacterium]